MRIEIDSIIIKKRVRKDLRDIASIKESMKKYGQLNPIIINRNNLLIAGNRRLEAAKQLGWNSINAIVIDKEDEVEILELELEENIQRNNLTSDEISEGFSRIDNLKNPGFLRRILNFFKKLFNRIFKRKRR